MKNTTLAVVFFYAWYDDELVRVLLKPLSFNDEADENKHNGDW